MQNIYFRLRFDFGELIQYMYLRLDIRFVGLWAFLALNAY